MNAFGAEDSCLTNHPVYFELSENREQRYHDYRELFSHALNYEQLHDIRRALNHELVLGSCRFKEKIETMTNRRVELGKPGRPKVNELEACYFVY